jgi:hypothetical protein
MSNIEIGRVENPTHVEWSIAGEENARFEVYAGQVDIGFKGGRAISRVTFSIYLPLKGTTIRSYGTVANAKSPRPKIEAAVLVTPNGFKADEDEEFLCAIDAFKLRLEPQIFGGVADRQLCLVLEFDAAIMNGVLQRVGYNVTLRSPLEVKADSITLEGDAAPQ